MKKKFLLILLILGILLAVAYVLLAWRADQQFAAELSRIAATGAPVRPADLRPAPIADKDNAAIKMMEAYAWLRLKGNRPLEEPGYSRNLADNGLLPAEFAQLNPEIAARVLAHLEPYLALLEESAERSQVDWGIDWDAEDSLQSLPGLIDARKAVNAMTARAVHAASTPTGGAQAARDIALALALADHCDASLLISHMIWIACHDISLDGIRLLLGAPGFDAVKMREAVDDLLAGAGDLSHTTTAFMGERAFFVGEWQRQGHNLMRSLDGVAYLQAMQALLDLCSAPYHEARPEIDALLARAAALPWYYFACHEALPGVARCLDVVARFHARVSCARVVLAIAAFRQKHGNWPAEEELAAMFPDGVPRDPQTGKAFPVEPTADGALRVTDSSGDRGEWVLPAR